MCGVIKMKDWKETKRVDVICQTSEYSDYNKVRMLLLREKSTVNNWCLEDNNLIMSFIFLSHINWGTMEVSLHILLSFSCSLLNIAFLCVASVRYFPSFLPSGEKVFLFQIQITASTILFWGHVCVCVWLLWLVQVLFRTSEGIWL